MNYYRSLPADIRERWLDDERTLGIPTDAAERSDHWHRQRTIWAPWMYGVHGHRWRFHEETPCLNCGDLTTTMVAGANPPNEPRLQQHDLLMSLCVPCLSTGVPWYPTGWVMARGTSYVSHSERCTSHSSYPTSSSSMPYEERYSPSEIAIIPPSRSKSTSSSGHPNAPARKSSTTTLSSPSGSRRPMSLPSATKRN